MFNVGWKIGSRYEGELGWEGSGGYASLLVRICSSRPVVDGTQIISVKDSSNQDTMNIYNTVRSKIYIHKLYKQHPNL